VKSACSVADNNITVSCNTCLNGIVNNCGRVCTFFVLYYVHISSFCPYIKLVYGSSTEGICRTQDDFLSLCFIHGSHFAYGGGLTCTVYTYNEDNGRYGNKSHILASVKKVCNNFLQFLFYFTCVFYFRTFHTASQFLNHLNSRIDSHISHNEYLFKLNEKIVFKGIKRVKHFIYCTRHLISRFTETEIDFTENSHCYLLRYFPVTEYTRLLY